MNPLDAAVWSDDPVLMDAAADACGAATASVASAMAPAARYRLRILRSPIESFADEPKINSRSL